MFAKTSMSGYYEQIVNEIIFFLLNYKGLGDKFDLKLIKSLSKDIV